MTSTINDKVKISTREGKIISLDEWQRLYNLPVGSTRIGQFFYLTEHPFTRDLNLFGELIVNELLIRFLDAVRKATNNPQVINSFNRSKAYQQELKDKGFRTAEFSPHEVTHWDDGRITGATAADVDTLSEKKTRDLVETCKVVSQITGIKVRLGFEQYLMAKPQQTFVHIDVCPEYYATGKPWHNVPHPQAWEKEITW